MIDYSKLPLAKPEPKRRAKARVRRQERAVATLVRQQTVERDGYCLIASRIPQNVAVLLGPCGGPSEWAHIGEFRRYRTRGQVAAERHSTKGSGQLCTAHHRAYDSHQFDIDRFSDRGMDGPIGIVRRAA